MGETRQLAIFLLITTLIGVVGLTLAQYLVWNVRFASVNTGGSEYATAPAIVEEYRATIYLNGTLVEEFTYQVWKSNELRMLYRLWKVPVSLDEIDQPYVEVLSIEAPSGTVEYAKDRLGNVLASSHEEEIRRLAFTNEVGCYYPQYFEAGRYRVSYVFRLHPPIEYDGRLCHLNLKLADEHIPYHKVTVLIEDNGLVKTVYSHPPSLQIVQGSMMEIRGNSAGNELLEVEMLLEPDVLEILDGFVRNVPDVESVTAQANAVYSYQSLIIEGLRSAAKILVISFPLFLLLIYFWHGREGEFIVPNYLSYVPNPDRKPWFVNLAFKHDSLKFDKNGFYATVLDLHRQGKIKMTPKNHGLRVEIIDPSSNDTYEKIVLGFLESLSHDNILDTDSIDTHQERDQKTSILFGNRRSRGRFQDAYSSPTQYATEAMMVVSSERERIIAEHVVSGRRRIAPILLVSIALLAASVILALALPYHALVPRDETFAGSVILLIQSIAALAAPLTLFGRWKGMMYKEKLEWNSFKRLLSDLAMIKRYAPQDLSIWKEWLIFGTTLGVGEKVVEAMKELRIPMVEADIVGVMPTAFRPIDAIAPVSSGAGRSGGSGGGGHGGGGGFGGGGGGAR